MQWEEPAPAYKSLYGKFVRTPVRWDDKTEDIDYDATYDDPKKLFPKAYVEYMELVYGEETVVTGITWVDLEILH